MRLMTKMTTSSSDFFGLGPLLLWTVVIVFQYVVTTNVSTFETNSTEWSSASENVSNFLQNNNNLTFDATWNNNTSTSRTKTFVTNDSTTVTSMDIDDNWLINVTNNYQEMINDSYYESEAEDEDDDDNDGVGGGENTDTEDDEPERATWTYKSTTTSDLTTTTTTTTTTSTNIIKSTETTASNVTIIKRNDSVGVVVVVGISSMTPTLSLDTSTYNATTTTIPFKDQLVTTNSTTVDDADTSTRLASVSSTPTTLKTTVAPPLERTLKVTTSTSSAPFIHKEVVVNAEMVSPKLSETIRTDDDDDDDQEEEDGSISGQSSSSLSSSQTHTMVYFDFRRQCPEEHAGDVWWNRTYGGVIAVRYCPGGYTGKVYRMCYYGGTWGDVDFSECRVQHLIKLKHLLYYHVHKNLTDGFHSLADELLTTLLRYRLRSVDDYVESLDSLNIIINARVPLDFDLGQDFKYLKAILKISDMLFSKFDNKWTFPEEQQDMVTMKLVQVLHGMTHFGNLVAEGIKKSSRSVIVYSDYAHIGLEAKVIRGDEDYRISPAATGSSVHLPARLYKIVGSKEKYVVVTMWYSGITSSLQEYDGHIDSAIFATTIHPGRDMHLLAGPVTMTLSITEKVNENDIAECGFLRRTFNRSSLWSRAGCTVSEVRSSSVTCICHHMTNIAVVIRPRHHEGHLPWRSVSVAVMIGCAISLVALVLTFVSHVYVLRYQSSESSLIVLNLILAMTTAEIVFMEGIQATSNPEVCEGVSIVLHYVYLVSSFWLLSLGIHVYVSTRRDKDVVSSTGGGGCGGHMRDYCLLSWVVPIILVVITFAVNPRGYEIRKYCWLSIERGMLISYIVPIFCLITVNTTLMVLVLKHLFETKVCMKKCDIDKTRTAVRASVILLPYHGVNWFFGVLAMEDRSTDIFQYIFAISTAVQGLLIFLFFGLLQSEVRKAFRHFTSKVLRRRKSSDLKLRRSRRKLSKVDAEPLLVVQEISENCVGIVHTHHHHQGSNLAAQCLHGSEEPFILAEEQFPIT